MVNLAGSGKQKTTTVTVTRMVDPAGS